MITTLVLLTALAGRPASEPALKGLDPVHLCAGQELLGREELEVRHGRFSYRFADEASRARFLAEPERWGIQWGGGCARMGPLSGVGSPERWVVHEGRIYVFASDACRDTFRAAPERFVVPAVEPPAATEASRAKGRAWIERAVDAHGGAAAIDALDALRFAFEEPSSGWHHEVALVVARSGELTRRSTWIPPEPDAEGYDTRWVLGADAFVDEGDASFPLTSADQQRDLRRYAHREPITLLWARADDGFQAVHLGAGELGGAPTEDVLVHTRGLTTTLHLDPPSAQILGLSWRGRLQDGATRDVVETFSETRDVAGVLLPTSRTVALDGEERVFAWDTVERVERPSR